MNPLVPFTFYLDWICCAQFAGLCWAKEKGLYADAGLDVRLVPWGEAVARADGSAAPSVGETPSIGVDGLSGELAAGSLGVALGGSGLDAMGELIVAAEEESVIDKVLRSTVNGRLSAGSCEDNLVVSRAAKDGSVKVLGVMLQETPLVLMSLPEQRIRSLADLRGKHIGMHADGIRVLEMLLELEGIPLADLTIEEVGFDLAHLPEGRFDAQQGYAMTEPVQLQAMGIHVDLLTLQSPQLQPYAQTYFAPSAALETDRQVFRAFLVASTVGWRAACSEPDEAARTVARMMGDPSQEPTQRLMLDRVIPLVAGRLPIKQAGKIEADQWKRNLATYFRAGLIDRRLELADVAVDLTESSVENFI
jgi:ABC-type nitrate/sulfonate/bicarbonate transport system substrate-binding protein